MTPSRASRSSELRCKLEHPVIDTDGHMVELFPVIFDGTAVESDVNTMLDRA